MDMLLRKKSQLVQTIATRTARIINALMIFFMRKVGKVGLCPLQAGSG